jgi:hypothetical protein
MIKRRKYTWNFDSKEVLEDFCYNFFHLRKIEKDKIYDEIKKYLEITQDADNSIKWKWGLIYFIAKLPEIK